VWISDCHFCSQHIYLSHEITIGDPSDFLNQQVNSIFNIPSLIFDHFLAKDRDIARISSTQQSIEKRRQLVLVEERSLGFPAIQEKTDWNQLEQQAPAILRVCRRASGIRKAERVVSFFQFGIEDRILPHIVQEGHALVNGK
jgi:hypothetical protein